MKSIFNFLFYTLLGADKANAEFGVRFLTLMMILMAFGWLIAPYLPFTG